VLSGSAPQQGLTHMIGPILMDCECHVKSRTKSKQQQLCLAAAGQQFIQASNTPFLLPPLVDLFLEANLFATAFKQVFEGTFQCLQGWQDV